MLELRHLITEMSAHAGLHDTLKLRQKSTAFEDNNGALALATAPHLTPRSKHYAIILHHTHVKILNTPWENDSERLREDDIES